MAALENSNAAEKIEKEEPKQKSKDSHLIDSSKLSTESIRRLNKKEVTVKDLVAERRQLKKDAEDNLKSIRKDSPKLISDKEHMDLLHELDETEDPELTKNLLEKIKRLPEEKEREAALEKNKEKVLDFESPQIQEKVKELQSIMKDPDTMKWIGTAQVPEFQKWAEAQLKKNPSIATAEKIIDDLKTHSREGLPPRKEFFERTLSPTLKKYNLQLKETPFFEKEGLSERKDGMKMAQKIERKLDGMKNVGLYSVQSIETIMKDLLKQDSLPKMEAYSLRVEKVMEKESSNYTNQNSSMFEEKQTLHEKQYRKMSTKSRDIYLNEYYKHTDLKSREKDVQNWKKLIEHEAKLSQDLADLYKDDKKGFEKAMKNFELLDFMSKEKALDEHKRLVENNDKETLHKSQDIVNKSLTAIDEARQDKTIGDTTSRRYKEKFVKGDLYTDKDTKKIDIKKLETMHKDLTSEKAVSQKEKRNLKAYEVEKVRFTELHKKFKKDNPDISEEELKRIQEKYDEGTWKQRAKSFEKLKELAQEKQQERKEKEKIEKETGITDKELREAKEKAPERGALIVYVNDCLAEDTPESIGDAYKMLHLYHIANPDKTENDATFLYLEETVARRKREILIKTKSDEGSKEMEEAVKRVASSGDKKEKIEEQAIEEINIEQTKLSEDRHKTLKAQDRARKESLKDSSEEEREIIEDYYELTPKVDSGKDHILGSKGDKKAEEMVEINLDKKVKMTREDMQSQREKIKQHQTRMYQKEGFTHVKITDQSGKEIDSREATRKQEEQKERQDEEILEEASNVVQMKRKASPVGRKSFVSEAEKLAGIREARRIREEEKKETPKKAA